VGNCCWSIGNGAQKRGDKIDSRVLDKPLGLGRRRVRRLLAPRRPAAALDPATGVPPIAPGEYQDIPSRTAARLVYARLAGAVDRDAEGRSPPPAMPGDGRGDPAPQLWATSTRGRPSRLKTTASGPASRAGEVVELKLRRVGSTARITARPDGDHAGLLEYGKGTYIGPGRDQRSRSTVGHLSARRTAAGPFERNKPFRFKWRPSVPRSSGLWLPLRPRWTTSRRWP
jgi:hypothetical protein